MFGQSSRNSRLRRTLGLAALCGLAFALSVAYVRLYLRGGPRIIDATSYFLEARSLAAGAFTFRVPDPTGSFRGRFLLASDAGHTLGAIFPPGYPLVLSLGVRLGVPLLVGPVLGALLVAVTYALARALSQERSVATVAAALSVVCAALRYHTADTMSHGLAALLGAAALTCALRRDLRVGPLLAGLCLGLLVATRPVSAAVSCALVGFVLRRRAGSWPAVLLGMLPGALLLLAQQRALTGHWLESTQLAYYSVSDAPQGCFRYGFGQGVGCRYEHGDYVARFLPHGFGARHALRNLAVHLAAFMNDATNAAPLSALAIYALARHLRSPLGLLGAGIALQALAYVPFYFDGDYAAGGARFLCEAIPLCQILVARASVDLRFGRYAPLLALAGFALYARAGHEALRDRDGGRPLFEPQVLARAGITRGLVLVDTDQGFNLGFDPRSHDARRALVIARARGDAHDSALFEALGRPPTYRYTFDPRGRTPPFIESFTPPASRRWEAEAEWPALLRSGSAYPIHFPCASRGRALRLFPGTEATFRLPSTTDGVDVGWASTGSQGAQLQLGWPGALRTVSTPPGCSVVHLPGHGPDSVAPLLVELLSGEGALDFIEARD